MQTKQAATLPTKRVENARNHDGKKERVNAMRVTAFDGEAFHEPVDARFWMSRKLDGASPVYCSVWIRTRDGRSISGYGRATGYGYHKESGALQAALDSAGVKLAVAIDGCGESAMRSALNAVCDAAGYAGMPRTPAAQPEGGAA